MSTRSLSSSNPLRVVSLGAGVQSTALLLMAARGEFDAVPACAIFADTGWEPLRVYSHLEWLELELGGVIPIYRVTRGNIRDDALAALNGSRYVGPPAFIRMPDGRRGPLRRQCTKEYKIEPIIAKIRQLIGLRPRQHGPKEVVVEQWFGISLDEAVRMRHSHVRWIVNRYPLIERGMTRGDCLRWLEDAGYPQPPKSACIGCPFHSDSHWREMRDSDPQSWSDAVEFDRRLRNGNLRGVRGLETRPHPQRYERVWANPWLHRSERQPEEEKRSGSRKIVLRQPLPLQEREACTSPRTPRASWSTSSSLTCSHPTAWPPASTIFAAPPDALRVARNARRTYWSRRALGRHFKAAGLPSPVDWVALAKALHAHRSIARGEPLGLAALAGGYPDQFTLSNAIHRITGPRPSKAPRGELDRAAGRLDRTATRARHAHRAAGAGSAER